jgi:DNA-binding transcriptional MocR family regulator
MTQRGRKHLLVREYVRSLIVDAEPGSPAPSERDLVEQFGVARMTVRHALDGLVAQDVQDALLERAGRWPLCKACEDGTHALYVDPDLGGPDPAWVCEQAGVVVAPIGGL